MRVGSNRLSLIHVWLYVSDEIQQLDLNDTSSMDLLRDVKQCKQTKKQKTKATTTTQKNKKRLILIKKSRAKKEEKGKDNENLQDMCRTTRACNRKKKEFAKYIICGLH